MAAAFLTALSEGGFCHPVIWVTNCWSGAGGEVMRSWNSDAIISLSFGAVKENRLDPAGCSSGKTQLSVQGARAGGCALPPVPRRALYLIRFHCLVFHTSEPRSVVLQESTLNYKYFKRHLIYYPSAESVQKTTRFTNLSERQRNTQKIKQRQTRS